MILVRLSRVCYLFLKSISLPVNAGDNDLLGGLTGLSPNEDGFDELIPGFGGSGQPSNKFVDQFMKHVP